MKALGIHAHFYQPPRENPFTGQIPQELGAEPYHDWNQRINDECYRPNARLGNFALIGFNLGPTLASWLEKNDPFTYQAIVEADRQNVAGHGAGNAIAQAYNHTILPLATRRDKDIQIAWGIADFEHRFRRKPEGMWLAETAVDLATLEVLAEHGISYTILAPWQVENSNVDVTEPYFVSLPGGRRITVLLFDGLLAKNISWNPRVTQDAGEFAELCLPMRANWHKERRGEVQVLLIANDGEYYGHHLRGRERFLNDLLSTAATGQGFTTTYSGLYLRDHPAQREVRIAENTAWSCYHGISRWKETCPCIPGDGSWKGHLRRALDHLAERMDRIYEAEASRLLSRTKNVPERPAHLSLLHSFVAVVLGRIDGHGLVRSAEPGLEARDVERLLDLLWSQYYRQLMFTSCGFFFEDLSRLEPKNNIACAAKAIELVRQATGQDLEPGFVADLEQARSAITGQTGRDIYQELIPPPAPDDISPNT